MGSPVHAHPSDGDILDVIIVGGGIMGSCAAYQSAKRGLNTLLLEQFDFLHPHGSSHGHSRTIRATYPEPYYPPMVSSSALLWEDAQSESGMHVYFPTPHIDLGHKHDSSLRAVISTCRSLSLPHTIYHHPLSPDHRLHLPPNWLAILSPLGGILNPTMAVSMFLALSRKNGAVLKDRAHVRKIYRCGQEDGVGAAIVVSTSAGESFRARKCIVTVGAWARKLLGVNCGMDIPLQPVETTVSYWRIKEGSENEYTVERGFPTFAFYGNPYLYGTPSLEYPGLIKIAVHGGRGCDPEERTGAGEVTLDEMKALVEVVFGGTVEVSGEPVVRQPCMYSLTPDEDFIIDYAGGGFGKHVVVGCGFSGHGFKMGPLVGKMLVDMAVEEKEPEKWFRVDRFAGKGVGNTKEFDGQVGLEV